MSKKKLLVVVARQKVRKKCSQSFCLSFPVSQSPMTLHGTFYPVSTKPVSRLVERRVRASKAAGSQPLAVEIA